MVTIYDIAKKTGYSISTVSKVLNNYSDVGEKAKKIISEAVNELGYYPNSSARALSTKRSWTIGVVFVEDSGIGIEHPFFNAVIESFKKFAEKEGYDLLFASNNIGNEPKTYVDHFLYRGVDGVVVVCSALNSPNLQKLIESDVPSVVIDMDMRGANVVYSDNVYGSELAVEYLLSLGHKKIAHLYGSETLYVGEQRLKGFYKAMKKNNLAIVPEYVVDGGIFTYEGGKEAMKQILNLEDPPTAIYAAGDLMAIGAIAAIQEAGLNVPNDFSIVGFDDIQISKYMTPGLTTIKQETSLIGKTAANLLIDQINTIEKQLMSVKIPVRLIERTSCAAVIQDVKKPLHL
ncbi:LacI family transcriptional regulator [Natronobacillus azotifigens]|uniref:LacI family DNA-binding transcriptional regulator n=1 Tax=Natronobacillus azotifigens TaxID=472978 RepID=A0A9J6RFV0_9BACI|nr:LacI family DNA-binding transcriptional regulator [Natronobacillus azotifigens]MCZ0704292.1 LacI family DNA-binding transcriptional regulator [Natronobacillus azotifigens]